MLVEEVIASLKINIEIENMSINKKYYPFISTERLVMFTKEVK
jgi:hypothetical protein